MKKILFISGSIGLGHIPRDLAIANELRGLKPDIDIHWLAADPAARVVREAGEFLLPESDLLANENVNAEQTAASGRFHLNLLSYLMAARGSWKHNVELFQRVLAKEHYDLIIGDETYEISLALKHNPDIKKAPYVVIYDFIGLEAMTCNPLERLAVYIWNRKWAQGYKQAAKAIDASLFVGEEDDIPDRSMGFLLPKRRVWARYRQLNYLGYILPFDPRRYVDRDALRSRLGYGQEPLVVCALGGTAVGRELLELCGNAYPIARGKIPELKMLLVCGPRLDPATIRVPAGVEVRGYVPNLVEHLAASDLAVVQGGGTVTLELSALRRPFIYFPLEGHFEQNKYVAARLARQGAGKRMDFSHTSPDALATEITAQIGREAAWPPIAVDGACKAAQILQGYLQ